MSSYARVAGRGVLFKIFAITVSLAVFFVIMTLCLEGFLRFYYRDVLSTADGWSYFSLKSQPLFNKERNSWRFRGKPFSQTPDARYRIVISGDSFTWGQGVYPASERFTDRIELFLSKTENQPDIEIINIGLCGFNLPHHYKFLHFVDAIKPDYVLYQWFINDMVLKPDYSQYKTAHLISNKNVHTWLWKHSVLYYVLQRGYGSMQRKMGTKKAYTEYLKTTMQQRDSAQVVAARELLEKFIEHHKEKERGFGIVLFPSFAGPMDQYSLSFLHEQVLDVCSEQQIECLDLRKSYLGIDHKKLWANVFDPHPGELAHKIAAEAIIEYFGPTWRKAADEKKIQISGDINEYAGKPILEIEN